MTATASNTANLTLNRTQSSAATGATPTQLQDDTAGSETDGAIAGLGAVRLIAKTPGTNNIKVRANDTKNQTATSLNFGTATQRQGHEEGGWTVDLSGTDTGTANTGGAVDVDLGTPGSNEGILKNWTQTAAGPLGANITRDQDQIDDIKLPLLGKSPKLVQINGRNTLQTNEGGHSLCRAESAGHAQVRSVGELECNVTAGTTVRQADVTWDAQTWGAFVHCEVNQEDCEDGTLETNVKGVDIRILGSYKKNGQIPVAILTNPDDGNPATVDDATTVDPASVCFGFAPPDPSKSDCSTAATSLTDVDSDGDTDRMLHFDANETGLKPSSDEACLTGETYDGQRVEGCGPLPKG